MVKRVLRFEADTTVEVPIAVVLNRMASHYRDESEEVDSVVLMSSRSRSPRTHHRIYRVVGVDRLGDVPTKLWIAGTVEGGWLARRIVDAGYSGKRFATYDAQLE